MSLSDSTAGRQPEAMLLEELRALLDTVHSGGSANRNLTLDASLERELGLDSLSRMELASRLERRFERDLPAQLVVDAQTPRDLLAALLDPGRSQSGWRPGPRRQDAQPRQMASPTGLSIPTSDVQTLPELLVWQAQRKGDAAHVTFLDEEQSEVLSYSELLVRAQAIAAGLQSDGVGAGDTVALMLPSGVDYFCAFLGVQLAGAIPVPIYPPVRLAQLEEHLLRHRKILDNAQVKGLVSFAQAQPVAKLFANQVRGLERVWSVAGLEGAAGTLASPRIAAEDTAFLQYTSGSTGTPKGVVLDHRAVLASLVSMGQAVGLRDEEVFVSWLPLYHDMGLIGAWLGSLYHGMPLVLMSPLTFLSRPVRWLEAISQYQGTLSGGPNFAYELCTRRISDEQLEGLDLRSWRMAFNGAEPVNADTMDRFAQRFATVGFDARAFSPVYGLAEATLGVSFTPPGTAPVYDRVERRGLSERGVATPVVGDSFTEEDVAVQVSSGVPIPGFEVRTVDSAGRETSQRQVGHVQFAGPGACRGYFRNSEATDALFDQRWVSTGDLGYIANGELFITGRVKDLIIRGGRNISPYEIENAAADVGGVRRGCVAAFGVVHPDDGTERLVVAAETKVQDDREKDEVRRRIEAAGLAVIGQPIDEVVMLPPNAVLKTSSGKIRRVEMAAAYVSGDLFREQSRPVWRQLLRVAVSGIPGVLRGWGQSLSAWLYAIWWWLCLLPAAAVAGPVTIVLSSPATARRVCGMLAGLVLILVAARPRISGLAHYPRAGPFVVVCNHASYMDGLLLHAVLPAGGVPWVVKGELADNTWARRFLRGLGSIFVQRFDSSQGAAHVDELVQRLESGASLGVFPEGTLHRMPGLLGFQMGGFLAAARSGVPIVPVVVRGTRSMLRDGSWFPRLVPLETEVLAPVMVPEEIEQSGTADESARLFARAVGLRDQVRAKMLDACGEPDLVDRRVLHELADALAERKARKSGSAKQN